VRDDGHGPTIAPCWSGFLVARPAFPLVADAPKGGIAAS
jgi:hypothetical protein